MITDYDYSKIDKYEELRKIQLKQIEILNKIDQFCKKNSISYSIAYGTMLGAVRHGGFIPWDDDMDICMLRSDYDKFLSLWQDDDKFILQNHTTNSDFTQTFSKIRMKNTAFVQENDLNKSYHKGIFVDIFPFDRKADGYFKQKLQIIDVMLYQLYFRGYVPENNGLILKLGSALLLKIHNRNNYNKLAEKHLNKIKKYNSNKELLLFDTCTFSDMKKSYDKDLFENLTEIEFDGYRFSVIRDYEKFLKICYGDYMKLPPKDEQTWYHHPIFISFDSEYEED